ncbi:hypothetical protein ES319_D13G068500v1 [Gossypium barbadense]|uniref:Leucine-rich repeat-containing N-terminal plant-type domain-containing protein n=1 Tax=Gossypium barbadense TaxID=3634 RepID=A0A5J5NKU6_GOSBA|nr:hypothetical protein ES319_D13G068500v1 [Gossypium barbadense]PPD87133.1 hypothetical protein GOBAR_DD15922 [Gossypium barbadense]
MGINTSFCWCFILVLLWFQSQGCLEEERAALLQIKDSMGSYLSSAFSNWYVKECCDWEGVVCDPSQTRIQRIFFPHLRSDDSEPWFPNATLFAEFKDLRELELPGNHIGGFISIQAFKKLKHLRKLNLRDNSIQNGSNLWWGKYLSLYNLDLSGNKLQGNFPDSLCANLFLRELILSRNNLFGSINSCLGNMISLRLLDLSENQFNGSFPSLLISNLTNIESLVLSSNEFQGMISLCVFANLSRLSELDISFNHLEVETEMMSPSCSPSFRLSTLSLGGCNVKKIYPWMFHNITSELRLSNNNLTGPFISNFQNITSKLTILDISDNFLRGTLPEDINLNFSELRHLDLSGNSFNGNLPVFFTDQLQMLDLSNNQFQGEIPYSIKSNMSCLLYLGLSQNNLTGDLFPKNSSLPNLRWLHLNNNRLSGTFPYALSKSMKLRFIDIQNNELSGELSSYLPVLPKLKILILRGNQFEGQLPVKICQMRDLHLLDLSENDLSGDIPDCVDNVTSWLGRSENAVGYLPDGSRNGFVFTVKGRRLIFKGELLSFLMGVDVSCNRLAGKIPIQMTRLKGIRILNVSNNLLTGQIPSSLVNLENLESLDLSHNNFFGVLPHELVGLPFLVNFNVSFNNLSGMIPIANQFGTFLNDSYLGNPDLCGQPLSIKCNGSTETPPIYARAEKSVSIMYFAVLIGLFFIVICLE